MFDKIYNITKCGPKHLLTNEKLIYSQLKILLIINEIFIQLLKCEILVVYQSINRLEE